MAGRREKAWRHVLRTLDRYQPRRRPNVTNKGTGSPCPIPPSPRPLLRPIANPAKLLPVPRPKPWPNRSPGSSRCRPTRSARCSRRPPRRCKCRPSRPEPPRYSHLHLIRATSPNGRRPASRSSNCGSNSPPCRRASWRAKRDRYGRCPMRCSTLPDGSRWRRPRCVRCPAPRWRRRPGSRPRPCRCGRPSPTISGPGR